MLKVTNLHATVEGKEILRGINLEVKAGEVLVEYDKLIDQQLERAAITSIAGFAKISDGAAAVLNV